MKHRTDKGRRVTVVALIANAGLAGVKLVSGLLGNSYALVADAAESFSDLLSSAIVWSGLSLAAKPPDENHPYGHGRADSLAALAVAIILVAVGLGIAIEAVREIRSPHAGPAPFTLFVLVGVVLVKELLFRYAWRTGTNIDSTALCADAWHHRADALTSMAAGIGIAIALIGGPGYEGADDWAALLACGVIFANGIRFGRVAIRELMETQPQAYSVDSIIDAALRVQGARAVEKVMVRKLGPTYYVDLHLEVDPEETVRRAHAIAHDVKDVIMQSNPEVVDVLIHIEPEGGVSAKSLNP